MKRNYSYFLLLPILLLGALITFTSCDEEKLEASRLAGDYEGNFGMYYTFRYRNGQEAKFYSSNSYLQLRNYAFSRKGDGVQIDYYRSGPYTEIWHDIRWSVNTDASGRQYISFHYLGESEWDTNIYDYVLNSYEFRGYFDNSNNRFNLYSLNVPTGWSWDSYYRSNYGCSVNYGWKGGEGTYYYYRYAPSKKDSTSSESDSVSVGPNEAYIPPFSELKFGNSLAEQQTDDASN